jgi:hypothetical protein
MKPKQTVAHIWQYHKSKLIWGGCFLFLFALTAASIGYTLNRKHEIRQAALAKGLDEITIIKQTETGQTKKLNITETVFNILTASIRQKGRLDSQAKREISNLSIKDVRFPPLPEQYLRTYETSRKEDIAQYFQKVYNILNRKHEEVSVQNITKKAVNRQENGKSLENLRSVNETMYYDLVDAQVPQPALKVHKSYLRIVQLQYHLLNGLSKQKDDPLGRKTNYLLAVEILQELRPRLNTEIKALENQYGLKLQNQTPSDESQKTEQSDQ